jgi:hypothetical protein
MDDVIISLLSLVKKGLLYVRQKNDLEEPDSKSRLRLALTHTRHSPTHSEHQLGRQPRRTHCLTGSQVTGHSTSIDSFTRFDNNTNNSSELISQVSTGLKVVERQSLTTSRNRHYTFKFDCLVKQ